MLVCRKKWVIIKQDFDLHGNPARVTQSRLLRSAGSGTSRLLGT